MAGVINHTARQLNMKAGDGNSRITVRLKPGFNVVDDKAWSHIKKSDYAKTLKKRNWIDFGKKALDEDAELADGDVTAQAKIVTPPTANKKGGKAAEPEDEAEDEDEDE